jgi:hypothetical protein
VERGGPPTVAYIAEDYLTERTKKKLDAILGGPDLDLPDIATWADEVRATSRPQTGAWHFIDIDVRATITKKDQARYCPSHDCVLEQISAQSAILKDTAASDLQKFEALKFLVHFIGDLHQPFHWADDAHRGGNQNSSASSAPPRPNPQRHQNQTPRPLGPPTRTHHHRRPAPARHRSRTDRYTIPMDRVVDRHSFGLVVGELRYGPRQDLRRFRARPEQHGRRDGFGGVLR